MFPAPAFLLAALAVFLGASLLRGWLHAFFAVPATLLHEFSHYLVAYVTRSQPAPMDIVPRKVDDAWVLGSVRFHPGALSAAFVALAPLLLLPLAWMSLPVDGGGAPAAQAWRGAFFAWCVLGAWPSRMDWEIALRYPLGLLLLGFVVTLFLHFGQAV